MATINVSFVVMSGGSQEHESWRSRGAAPSANHQVARATCVGIDLEAWAEAELPIRQGGAAAPPTAGGST
jgi:hypothetical protein